LDLGSHGGLLRFGSKWTDNIGRAVRSFNHDYGVGRPRFPDSNAPPFRSRGAGGGHRVNAQAAPTKPSFRVWTIGHSTRSIEELAALLAEHSIEAVADVRRYPGSRRLPQFGRAALESALRARGIEYVWLPQLGGRRRPAADSPNTAWRSSAFMGYADYMGTDEFADGLVELVNLACGLRTAIMCAEAVWWRCHRGLISDVLRWLGFDVVHILGPGSATPHPYTAAATVTPAGISYAAPGRDRGLRRRGSRA
jgi:hypothetical protein